MVAQCIDLAPRGLRLQDDELRCVGIACEYLGEKDLSTISYKACIDKMKETGRVAKSHGFRIIVGTTESRHVNPYACHLHAMIRRRHHWSNFIFVDDA